MSITRMTFLFVFLPVALGIYYIANNKVREAVLLVISIVFYAIGSMDYVAMFTCIVCITVFIGRLISRNDSSRAGRCALLVFGILINLCPLVYYKYADPTLSAHVLPLGISFFTFKSVSYLVDVYKHKVDLTDNPIYDALYLSFFAQIQSGPLSRYKDMSTVPGEKLDFDLFSKGMFRFLIGYSKKVLIANMLSNITTEVFNTPFDLFSTSYAWLGSICFSLQLFFDFSGYSDMAIGLTQMFGFTCPENFDYPYITESVTRFWRRWHITLSEWFRDYVYIPLGGSRNKSRWRVYFNLFVVWILTGIWHGSSLNFIAWGLGYFVVISLERLFNLPGRLKSKAARAIYRVFTLAFINFQWVLFNSNDLLSGLRYIKRMVVIKTNDISDTRALFLLKDYSFFIVAAIIFSMPIIPKINEMVKNDGKYRILYETVMAVLVIVAFIWSISFVVAGQNNPFAYANF